MSANKIASAERTESTAIGLDDGIPSLYEELNRKTLETAIDLIADHQARRISSAQFYIGFQTLFKTVNGLASSEVTGYAFAGSGMVEKGKDSSFRARRIFIDSDGRITFTVSITFGRDEVIAVTYSNGEPKSKKVINGIDKFDAVCDKVLNSGYKEVS